MRCVVDYAVPVQQRQEGLQPAGEIFFALQNDAQTLLLRVEGDDMFVSGVQASGDVEARLERDLLLGLAAGLPLLLGVVVLEPGGLLGRARLEHEKLLLHGLELLEVASADDLAVRRVLGVRLHGGVAPLTSVAKNVDVRVPAESAQRRTTGRRIERSSD